MELNGLTGFQRSNGTVGVRNHVIVLAAADNVNPLAWQLANSVSGVVCIRASFGRGQMGNDLDLALRTQAGIAAHPNVFGCLIVSFESESAERIAERVRARGRNATTLSLLDEGGSTPCLQVGRRILTEMQRNAELE